MSHLHVMVDAASMNDANTVESLREDLSELEDELKEWEKKYHVMNNIQGKTNNNFESNNNERVSDKASNKRVNHEDEGQTLKRVERNRDSRELERDIVKECFNSRRNSKEVEENDAQENHHDSNHSNHVTNGYEKCSTPDGLDRSASLSNPSIIPFELCEMSMETFDQDQDDEDDNEMDDQMLLNNNHSPPSSSSSSNHHGLNNSSYTSINKHRLSNGQFSCDLCSFMTNVRQRLVMHKKLHAGEVLYACDVLGCDYQSNYKGNIKIHKKHRHKDNTGVDDLQPITIPGMMDGMIDQQPHQSFASASSIPIMNASINHSSSLNHSSITSSQRDALSQSNHHDDPTSPNSTLPINMLPRRRRRRKKFRYTIPRERVGLGHSIGHGMAMTEHSNGNGNSTLFVCEVKDNDEDELMPGEMLIITSENHDHESDDEEDGDIADQPKIENKVSSNHVHHNVEPKFSDSRINAIAHHSYSTPLPKTSIPSVTRASTVTRSHSHPHNNAFTRAIQPQHHVNTNSHAQIMTIKTEMS
ncbi:unnamed protein product [Sphagnum balticum]